jgi:hypothetical protein
MCQINEKEFLKAFFSLSKHQRTILKRLVWYYNKYPDAHPTQAKIAERIPCSRKHVNRTIALFKRWGWISLESRGPRHAKRLFIPQFLASMDLDNIKPLINLKVTSEVTHSLVSLNVASKPKPTGNIYQKFRKKEAIEPLVIEDWVKRKAFGLSLEQQMKLSLVKEWAFDNAYAKAKFMYSQGVRFKDENAYVVGTAIKMQQEKTGRLPWNRFYQTFAS